MNLYWRLFWTFLLSRFRPRLKPLDRCSTRFRTSLFDLDLFGHMNNGRYFTLQDLGRVDLMLRNGVYKVMKAKRWYPVVVAESLNFRRSLEPFDAFDIETQVVGWTERHIILEHAFVRDGEVVAGGYVSSRFLRRAGGTVDVPEIMAALGIELPSPPLPDHVRAWLENQEAIKADLGARPAGAR